MYGEEIVGKVKVAELGPHSITTVMVLEVNSAPPDVWTFSGVIYVIGCTEVNCNVLQGSATCLYTDHVLALYVQSVALNKSHRPPEFRVANSTQGGDPA